MSAGHRHASLTSMHAALPAAKRGACGRNPGPVRPAFAAGGHRVARRGLPLPPRHAWTFDFLSNVTGVDWPDPAEGRCRRRARGRGGNRAARTAFSRWSIISTPPANASARWCSAPAPPTAVTMRRFPRWSPVFRSAEFQEREIFDLYGVVFTGHPDLRRILMWDEFVDHPMRKDYVAPDDYEYEPTPHDAVLEKAKRHYPAQQ